MKKQSFGIIAILFSFICFSASGTCRSVASAQGEPPNQPMTLAELNKLSKKFGVTEAVVAAQIEQAGIAFEPTPEVIDRLRASGVHQHLINTIKRAAEKKSASAA